MRRVNDLAGPDRADKQWTRLRRPAIAALTTATLANYVWQVPYAIHQYGLGWIGFPRLSVLLIVTLAWFVAATVLFTRRRRGGTTLLASFLAAEALFYVLHNVSGAFGRDLPSANPIVLIASVLGYVNLAAAIAGLAVLAFLATRSRRRNAAGDRAIPDRAIPGQAARIGQPPLAIAAPSAQPASSRSSRLTSVDSIRSRATDASEQSSTGASLGSVGRRP